MEPFQVASNQFILFKVAKTAIRYFPKEDKPTCIALDVSGKKAKGSFLCSECRFSLSYAGTFVITPDQTASESSV